jgi:hypothetical protein
MIHTWIRKWFESSKLNLGADIMAISGRIELEELVIEFTKVDLRQYRVRITCKSVVSEYFCNSRDLTATIAVAIHPDGQPEQRFQQFIP